MVQIASIVGTAQRQNLPDTGRQGPAAASGLAMGANPGLSNLGAGVSDAGAALAQAAMAYKRDQEQLRNFSTQTAFTELGTSAMQDFMEQTERLSGDGNGFTRNFMAGINARAADWLKAIPEEDRPRWEARVGELRQQMSIRAYQAELKQREAHYETTTGTQLDLLRSGIDREPGSAEAYRLRGEEIINSSGLPEQKKAELIQRWRGAADTAYAAARVRDNPDAIVGTLGGDTGYFRRLRTQESSGDDTAASRNSSARGRYQFTTGTWAGLVNSPEGKDAGLTLDGRGNAAQEDAAVRIFTQQNAARLAAADIPANEKNLYMMHFLGRNAGADFLTRVRDGRADENAAAAFPTAAASNRAVFFKPDGSARTVGEVYDLQTRRFSTASFVAPGSDPIIDRLPYQQRMSIREQGEREMVQRDNAAASADNARTAAQWNDLQLGIIDGRFGRADIDAARQSGWLNDASRVAHAYAMVERRDRDANLLALANEKLANPNASWNIFDQQDKQLANLVVQAQGGTAQAAFDVWQRTGILAAPGVAALRGAINSNDPQKLAAALQIASNMMDPQARGGNAFAGIEGREQIETATMEFQRLLSRNIVDNAEEAAKRVMRFNDPEFRARVAARDKEFEDLRKTAFTVQKASEAVADIFDTWRPFDRPSVSPAQRAAIAQDYVELVQDAYRETGDPEAAKNAATTRLRAMYGVSNGYLTRFPPEKVYPASGDPNDPHGYIYRQALDAAKEFRPGVEIDPKSVRLFPLPGMMTADPWRNGQPAPYSIQFSYKDASGQTIFDQTPTDGRRAFVADPVAERARVSEARRVGMEEMRRGPTPRTVTADQIDPLVVNTDPSVPGRFRALTQEEREAAAAQRNADAAAQLEQTRQNAQRVGGGRELMQQAIEARAATRPAADARPWTAEDVPEERPTGQIRNRSRARTIEERQRIADEWNRTGKPR